MTGDGETCTCGGPMDGLDEATKKALEAAMADANN